jgi:hypothetical protein
MHTACDACSTTSRGVLAPPGFLRASSGEVRQALDRRLRVIQGEEFDL